jgi:hypothetical protein
MEAVGDGDDIPVSANTLPGTDRQLTAQRQRMPPDEPD